MTNEERQQVEAALNIVNQAVDNWLPDEDSKVPRGQQWRQMLSAWGIVSGIVQQTMAAQPPQQQQQVMPHVAAAAAAANGAETAEQQAAEPVDG